MLTALPQPTLLPQPTTPDAIISPFLLDPATITSSKPYSTNLDKAIWLHMPVIIRNLQSRQHALLQLQYLSKLRHPNLEQFLGAVLDDTTNSIITEFINGNLLTTLLHQSLHPQTALSIAIDISRALLYLHATTGTPHGSLNDRSVIYDHVRKRAVLLLSKRVSTTFPCAAPECSQLHSIHLSADVYSLAVLVLLLFRVNPSHLDLSDVYTLPRPLHHVVLKALSHDPLDRPPIQHFCQALVEAQRLF